MSELLTYDPWASVKSRNGIPADELISMLQKSIRRGEVKNALIAAYELHISSPQLSDKLWRRLLTISVEDVGFGDPNAPEVIWSLYKSRRDFAYPDGDQPILLVFAVRYLCRCRKDRSSDELKYMRMKQVEHGALPEPPDVTYDMHTVKGREMGRGRMHFLKEASRVEPELDLPWVQRLYQEYLDFCKAEEEQGEESLVELFLNSCWDIKE